MSKKRIVIPLIVGLGMLVVGFVLYAYYEFTHNIPLTAQQLSSAEIAYKGAMGEVFFSGQPLKAEVVPAEPFNGKTGLDALLAPAPSGNKGQGLIEAYQKDPQKFKHYADMLDTAINAKQVGDVVVRQGGSHPPATSEPLPMEANLKVDAWGDPFCIIPIGENVAVCQRWPIAFVL